MHKGYEPRIYIDKLDDRVVRYLYAKRNLIEAVEAFVARPLQVDELNSPLTKACVVDEFGGIDRICEAISEIIDVLNEMGRVRRYPELTYYVYE